MSVYLAAIQYGDAILGMNLSHGGHLTHGHPLNFSGLSYKVFDYGVSRETETIDYDETSAHREEHQPKLLVCGARRIRGSSTLIESVKSRRALARGCSRISRTSPGRSSQAFILLRFRSPTM